MPRQSNGSWLQPGGTTAVTNTIISSTAYNALTTDIGVELGNSLDRTGRGAMLAALNFGAFRGVNAQDPAAAQDVATKNYVDTKVSPEWWLKRDSGAVGDGTTDDTTAINSWIAKGLSTGVILRAEPGTFMYGNGSATQWALDVSLRAQTAFIMRGSGRLGTVFDVTRCTNATTQFLLEDLTGMNGSQLAAFYTELSDFTIKGNNPGGRAVTIGRDPVGAVPTDYWNGCKFAINVVNAATTNGSVALRLNTVITSTIEMVATAGAVAAGVTAIEFAGVTMCKGWLAPGNAGIGINYVGGYSFGNHFTGCDFEVMQNCFQSNTADAGPDVFCGQFVWGSTASVGTDGTTPFAVMNSANRAIFAFGNLSSGPQPVVTGAAAAKMITSNAPLQYNVYGGTPLLIDALDAGAAGIELISGTGTGAIQQLGQKLYISNFGTGSIQINKPIQYNDGTQKQSGDHLAHLSQPSTPPANGPYTYTNSNTFPVYAYWTATSTSAMNVIDTVSGNIGLGVGNASATYPIYLPPGWAFTPTYTGTGNIKITPAG